MATDIRFLFRAAHDALTRANKVLIVAHKKPDGDTLGASAAMLNFCRRRDIAANAFCLDAPPPQYGYIPRVDEFTADPAVFGETYDVLAVFDSGDLRYAGVADLVAGMPAKPAVLNFDHHATNERYGDMNLLDTGASSTAEVVYEFFRAVGVEIDRDIATCLLTGILTDTSSFSNPGTTQGSLEAASELLRSGAKIQEVANKLMRNKSIPALRLWGQVLSRLKYNPTLGVASTAIFSGDLADIDGEHVEGISNFLNQFLDVAVVLVLTEQSGGKVKGSFRTAEDLDVSVPAKLLGGGGHRKAAGFTIPGRILETDQGWKIVEA